MLENLKCMWDLTPSKEMRPQRKNVLMISLTLCLLVIAGVFTFQVYTHQNVQEATAVKHLPSLHEAPDEVDLTNPLITAGRTISPNKQFDEQTYPELKNGLLQMVEDKRILNTASDLIIDANEKFGGLTKSECIAQFGERKYLPAEKKRIPPVLYSFPGSGNTWSRLLIEYATGIYTGSVYNDKSLLQALPGEDKCSTSQSVIKAHPFSHSAQGLRTGIYPLKAGDKGKCKKGGIAKFHRAIMLIRDPYDAFWSNFALGMTSSHVGGVSRKKFNSKHWHWTATRVAQAFERVLAVQFPEIEEYFAEEDYLYVKYEDLKNKETRVEALRNITQFVNISEPNDAQLECAFALADKRDTHRVVDKSETMSKEEAYTPSLVCELWAIFGEHVTKYGYSIWQNTTCSSQITNANVSAVLTNGKSR